MLRCVPDVVVSDYCSDFSGWISWCEVGLWWWSNILDVCVCIVYPLSHLLALPICQSARCPQESLYLAVYVLSVLLHCWIWDVSKIGQRRGGIFVRHWIEYACLSGWVDRLGWYRWKGVGNRIQSRWRDGRCWWAIGMVNIPCSWRVGGYEECIGLYQFVQSLARKCRNGFLCIVSVHPDVNQACLLNKF